MPSDCIDRDLVDRASEVVSSLRKHNLSAVTAESCTAGLIAAALSHVDGAGEVLEGAHVAYSKDQKAKTLGVEKALMERLGTVNADVVAQMVEGALKHSKADVAVAVSGVLGPSPDEDGNPVGMVFLAAQRRGRPAQIKRCDYGSQPHDVLRRRTVLDAFALLKEQAES